MDSSRFLPILFWLWLALVWLRRAYLAWRTFREVPILKPEPPPAALNAPKISILVPARNEEKNLEHCLRSLLAQDYPDFEIIVINDRSEDGTAAILKRLEFREASETADAGYSRRVLHLAAALPAGWTGKNRALAEGVRYARGEWLLFTDADTRHEPCGLSTALAAARKGQISMLSLLPRCLTGSPLENLIQPIAMAFLGLWFPLAKVNAANSKVNFANGQYLLIQRMAYGKIGGHHEVAHEFLEDFALMRQVRSAGMKAATYFGAEIYGTRMYADWHALWRGWRRIYRHAFHSNAAVLAVKALEVFLCSLLPFLILFSALVTGNTSCAILLPAGVAVLAMLAAASLAYTLVHADKRWILGHPAAALLLFLILLDAARESAFDHPTNWRG